MRACNTLPTFRWPSVAATLLTATADPRTSPRLPLVTRRSRARAVSRTATPAAAHGVSQPRPLSSRKTLVGSTPAAASTPGRRASRPAVPAGSGAPSCPTTTWSAVTRASVTRSTCCCELACRTACSADEHGDQDDRGRQRCRAPAVGGQARAREQPGGTQEPERERDGGRRQAEQHPAEQRGSGREQDAGDDREGQRGLAREDDRHRDPSAEAEGTRERLHPAGTGVFDRDLAQGLARAHAAGAARGGDHGELRDADAAAQGGGERDPRVARLEAVRRDAVVGEDPDDRVRERPARQQTERGRRHRQDQRLGGQQAADLARRRAQGAQHGGLAPALSDGERERAGHHEQRDGSGDTAHHAEDGDQAFAVGGLRVAGVGVGAVAAVEHVDAGAHRSAQPRAQLVRRRAGLGDDADALTRPGVPDSACGRARRRRTRPPGRDRGWRGRRPGR